MFIDNRQNRVRAAFLTIFFLSVVFPLSLYAKNKAMPLTASKDALALYIAGREKAENLEDPGTLFEQAIQKDPNFAMAYLSAGRTNQEFRKNLAIAVSLVDKVSPGEREWILAANDQANGNPVGRKQHLDQLLKLYPGDKRVHSLMAFYYQSVGDDANALRHFQDAVKLDKKYAPVYNNIGYAYLRMEKYPDAEAAFKTYIKLIPKNPNPYDSYAELLMKSGKYDESIAQYSKALAVDPTFFNSYRGMGNNYVYKGNYSKARETYRMMYDKAPDGGGRDLALVSELNSYISEGKIDDALAVNERRRATAEKEGDIQTLIGVYTLNGFIFLESGRLDDAAKQFAKADELRNDPSLPPALSANRRFFGILNNTRLLIARNDFNAAGLQLELLRQDASSRNTLIFLERAYNETAGYFQLAQKDYSKAVESFSKADPNDPFVWYHKALALEGTSDKTGASELFLKVANWNSLDDTGHAFVRSRAIAKRSTH